MESVSGGTWIRKGPICLFVYILYMLGRIQAHRPLHAMSRSIFVHLHTFDLRVHDSPSLHLSHDKSSSVGPSTTHFLPLYIFDPRQLDISHLPNGNTLIPEWVDIKRKRDGKNAARASSNGGLPPNPNHVNGGRKTRAGPMSRVAGFHRTSPHRLKYLLESVYELRETYRRSGGDMLIGYGKPEVLVPSLVKALGGSGDVVGVWAQDEITVEEKNMLDNLSSALDSTGIGLHLHDSKTLIPRKNLPFKISQTPDVYTSFRKKVEDLGLEPGRGMLATPLRTAKWETGDKAVSNVRVSIGQEGANLKPCPDVELGNLDVGQSRGGWIQKGAEADTLEGMYAALSAHMLEKEPIGGWSTASQGKSPPKMHASSAIPIKGGEVAALSRLESYVGHSGGGGNAWEGGHDARTYKDTRNGMVGDSFSTKFAALLSLGVLSPKEAGYRVGGLLQTVGHEKHKWDNVYCEPASEIEMRVHATSNADLGCHQGFCSSCCGATSSSSPPKSTGPCPSRRCLTSTGFASRLTRIQNRNGPMANGTTPTWRTRTIRCGDGARVERAYRSSTRVCASCARRDT